MSYDAHLRDGLRRSVMAFLIVIIALPLISMWATYRVHLLSDRMESLGESRVLVGRALRFAVDEESGIRGYLDTLEPAFLGPYRSTHNQFVSLLHEMPAQFKRSGMSTADPLLSDFARMHSAWDSEVARPLLANPRDPRALSMLRTGKLLMDNMRSDALAMQAQASAATAAAAHQIYDVVLASTAISIAWIALVGTLLVLFQRRALRREHRLVASIVKKREEVERLSEWRSRLLAMLAHDFKSQLTVLIGAAHLLEDFPQRRGDPQLLASLRSAGYTLAEMADNAILLARAQERKIVLQRSIFDVSEVVAGVVQRYGAEREFIVHHGEPTAMVDGDRSYVTRVLDNIIGNAVKYSEDPIDVYLENEAEFIRVRVRDRGIGIAETELPHIFEEYWRSDQTSWKQKGSGVGLFIVKTIMEAHGGAITVESRFGQGTVVTLRFPRALTAFARVPVTV